MSLTGEELSPRCFPCTIRAYLVEGDESLQSDFALINAAVISAWFEKHLAEAFRQLHQEDRLRRLRAAGMSPEQFVAPLTSAIESTVKRVGAGLDDSERAAAQLLAASMLKWGGAPGSWLLMPELPIDQRRIAVSAMADGRFDAVRGVHPGQLVRLAAHPALSQMRVAERSKWIGSLAAGAVRAGLARMSGGAPSAIAQFHLCVVHAAACLGDDDEFVLGDLAEAAGLSPQDLQAMRAEVSGAAGLSLVLRPGRGTRRVDELVELPVFRRAREWLGFDLDLRDLDWIDRLQAELPKLEDPWLQWAYAASISGPQWDRMLRLMVELGEGRRSRPTVLDSVRRAGLLEGPGAEDVLRGELDLHGGPGYESRVFRRLLELELRGLAAPAGAEALLAWFEQCRVLYFNQASTLASLPSVHSILRGLRAHPSLPQWLADLVAGLADHEWEQMEAAADRFSPMRGWLVRVAEQLVPERRDPRLAQRIAEMLSAEDQNLLRDLARRAGTGGSPPWFAIRLDPYAEFRIKEAAFQCEFLDEAAFKAAIVAHCRPLLEACDATPEEARSLKILCERCGRFMLKRINDAQPRSRTLDAFRRGDWRGMLDADRVEASGLGETALHEPLVGTVAKASWAVALLLSAALASVLVFGGVGSVAGPAPRIVAAPVKGERAVFDLPDWSPSPLGPGSPGRWAVLVAPDRMELLLPGAAGAGGGLVSRAAAGEYAARLEKWLSGFPEGVRVRAGGRPVRPGRLRASLPASPAEAGAAAKDLDPKGYWLKGDADIPGSRRRVIVIIEAPQADSDA